MLAEKKAEVIYFIARNAVEVLKRGQLYFYLNGNATLEGAQNRDRVDGDFLGAANDYYSVYLCSDDPTKRSDALIGLSQELINLQKFGQAREWLEKGHKELGPSLSPQEELILRGRRYEKKGWIAGYLFGFKDGLNSLKNASVILGSIPEAKQDLRVKESISTCFHLSGRNYLGLSVMGVNSEDNLYFADEYFVAGIRKDKDLDVETVNEKLGHGYAWRGKCALVGNKISKADILIDIAERYFQLHDEKFPNKGVMAHYELVGGLRDLQVGSTQEARDHFLRAVDIRENTGGKNYQKGMADAYAGIAATHLKERNFTEAFKYLKMAIRANYYVVLRGFVGG